MDPNRDLAPCLIGSGTLAHPRDMLRALETIENLEYSFTVHGDIVSEGRAALVKLMADPESSTLVVNGCLFLNVLSFRYLDFEQLSEESWGFTLFGDGSTLRLVSLPEAEDDCRGRQAPSPAARGDHPGLRVDHRARRRGRRGVAARLRVPTQTPKREAGIATIVRPRSGTGMWVGGYLLLAGLHLRLDDLERLLQLRIGLALHLLLAVHDHDDVGRQADAVDDALLGRQVVRDGELDRAAVG